MTQPRSSVGVKSGRNTRSFITMAGLISAFLSLTRLFTVAAATSKRHLSFTTVKAVFRHRIVWLSIIVLLAGLSFTLAAKYRSVEKTALANTEAKAQQGCCATVPATPRRMIGTYYNTEDGFQSSLVLNNKGPNAIAVTPILHSQSGQTFTGAQVFVNGESSLNVDLNALANGAGAQFKSGSFEFTYQGRMMEIGGGLRIVNAAKSLIFDEQLLEPGMKFSSPKLEAVYAIPSGKPDAAVIVTNTTAQPLSLNGTATFVGANGQHPINGALGAYETSVINLPNGLVKQSSAGAVSITHNGASGALLAMVHVWDKDKGFSATVNFADPAQGKTTQLHGAGLRLGSVNNSTLKPVIAVRNIGNATTTVTARVPYTKQDSSTATITLPQTSLAAGETKLLNTTHPGLGQTDIATAGLELEYTGAPGSVITSAHSASPDGNHVFVLPLKDPQGGMSSTGGYPWFIDGTSSTVVFIKNTTNESQKFHLGVVYQGGKWGSNLKTLAPGQTYLLDIKKVRDTQEKGSEGNTIPEHATSGHIAWSVRGKINKVLIGRAQTVDFTNALAATYECQCQCPAGYSYGFMTPNNANGFIGDTTTFNVYQVDTNCYGGLLPPFQPYIAYFFSENTGIATVDANGVATAVGAGATSIYAYWTPSIWTFVPSEEGYGQSFQCEESTVYGEASASYAVQNIDFTITSNTGSIKPTGVVAGLNGADPAITVAETQATITVTTSPPTPGVAVSLSPVSNPNFGELGNGGHVNHTGVRPVGTLSQASGTTGQNGIFTSVYTAPVFSGLHQVRATVGTVTKSVGFIVEFPGLQELAAGNDYTLDGATTWHPGLYNHFGTAIAVAALPLICSDYKAMYPGATNPEINDMSLPFGGKFDLPHAWSNDGSHGEHRVGRNCDFETAGIPASRWAALNQIFITRDVQNVNNETACCAHWHLRFRTH